MAEIVSELMYGGKTLKEIARLTNYQMHWIVFRKRNSKTGALVRKSSNLPEWVEVDERGMRIVSNPKPYREMFCQVQKSRGLPVQETWDEFLGKNPEYLKKGGMR